VYFGSAGGLIEQAYVENVRLSVDYNYVRLRTHWPTAAQWQSRGQFILGDKDVMVEFGQMFSESSALLRANSGTGWSFAFSASAFGQTAAWSITSGVITNFSHDGQDGDIHRLRGSIRALDYSAL
jgi:hypothetical protein